MLLFFIWALSYAQSREFKKYLNVVFSEGKLNKTFAFNTSMDKEITTTSKLTYLGTTPNGYKLVYVTETYPAAITRHGYTMLLVIDKKGDMFYYWDIEKPLKLKNGIVYFKHFDKHGKVYYYKQDLTKGLPKYLCAEKDDCFYFTTE
jgi:hypothetical protein